MRKPGPLTLFWLLEAYAVLLTGMHILGGVRTDEAKYLLSIPYPHPPLLRSIMAWTSSMPMHEFFWRLVFASLVVQSVWLLLDLGVVLTRHRRICLAASWLLSAAVILQAGSIVMAAMVALFGLVFLWTALHPETPLSPAMIACIWFAALFTAYQSVLYLPLVLSSLLQTKISRLRIAAYIVLPLVALALYTLTNPHALLTMAQASGQDAGIPVLERLGNVGWIWVLSGSMILSIAGTAGILTSARWDVVASFGLVLGFVLLTSQQYYAILFTPLLVGGLFLLLCRRRIKPGLFLLAETFAAVILVIAALPPIVPTPARAVMRELHAQGIHGPVLINGFFGHEWQYESRVPILRFSQELGSAAEADAQAFICTRSSCDDDVNTDDWVRLPGMQMDTWIRR